MSIENKAKRIVIGVDTGNRCMKTATQVMVSGLHASAAPLVFSNQQTIRYDGIYYQLTSERGIYRRDKTGDDMYFVLTLFGIVRELRTRGITLGPGIAPPNVCLAVGLPPAHIPKLREKFKNYFLRGLVEFEIDSKPVSINIAEVFVMAQGYSAIFSEAHRIRFLDSAYIVDIGGYTTDIIGLERGVVNPAKCLSEDAGMIHLYNNISDKLNLLYEDVPSEQQIEMLLSNPDYQLEEGMKEVAEAEATTYVNNLLQHLREKGVNLRLNTGVFVGGGSIRLSPFIWKSTQVRDPILIPDIKANAVGYEGTAKLMLTRGERGLNSVG